MPESLLLDFRSDAFPVIPGEDDETNPGLFGKSLAQWLRERLLAGGLSAGEVFGEDFGWCIPLPCPPHRGYVVCGISSDDAGGWRVYVFVEGGWFARLLGRDRRAESLARLYEVVKRLLEEAPEIRELRESRNDG